MDAKQALQFIEEMTENADKVQLNTLAEILTRNQETEYLRRFNLGGATDPTAFKSKVPVVTYEDIRPFIRRIADGDRTPILCAQPISEFIISTGTSGGEGKLIPTTQEDQDRRISQGALVQPILKQYVEGLDEGKSVRFMFIKPERRTQGGIVGRSALTRFFKNDLKNRNDVTTTTSPYEAVCCEDIFQSMYAQMLCGLYERQHVIRVGALFASGLLRAIRFLQLNWRQLTHDIRTGSLYPKVNDEAIRECMAGRVLRPDPELADFVARECEKDNWEGIITKIWPNAKFVDAIVTGSMSQYIPAVDYYSGGLPIACTLYASSECSCGINLNPFCDPSRVSYTIMPNTAYFEFLPLDSSDSEPVDLVDVELGKEYELVVTTYTGLYRYRVGDTFRVIGFHNSAPQFQFLARKDALLSIDTDKTDEATLQGAVENAYKLLSEFKTVVADYTSYVDTTTIPGHYVIFWELLVRDSNCLPSDELLEQCCLAIEQKMDAEYRRCRVVDKSIGPLEIRVVKRGSFEELMDYAVEKGSAAFSQYKTPKCVKLKPMLDLLHSRVVSSHSSPSPPHWSLEERL